MKTTARPSKQAPISEETPAGVDEPSPGLSSGKKRPASESEPGRMDGSQYAGSPSPKRLKGSGSPQEVEMSDLTTPLESRPSTTDMPAVQALSKAHEGWNQGVGRGLRTSFAGKDKLRKPLSQRASGSPVQPAAESVDVGNLDVGSLVMPSGNFKSSRTRSDNAWQAKFVKWCVRLMVLNKHQEGLGDPDILKEAWGLWLEKRASLSSALRAVALRAAKDTNLDSGKLKEMLSQALETEPEGPWDAASTGASSVETGQPATPQSEQQSNGGQSESNKLTSQGSQEANGWALPPLQSSSGFDAKQKDQHAWEGKFVAWCKSLVQLNDEKIKANTAQERNRVTEAYQRWVEAIDGLSRTKASLARRAAVHYAQVNSALLVALFAGGASPNEPQVVEPDPVPQEDFTPSPMAAIADQPVHGSVGVLRAEDAEDRDKYFPGIGPDETFCHMCASHGHDAASCPEMACRFCRDPQHRSFSCPTRSRCTKCRQLGHFQRGCKEKLALPREEMECAFCESRDHVDASCQELWGSFSYNPDTARKVRSLPVFCYCCGRQGHYGPVCGLNPQRSKENAWETWSQANCDRYLDPASSEVAIIGTSAGPAPSSERPDFGKSIVPKRHIFFEEADDDDADEFIRPPVQKIARVGNINFSSNNAGNRGGRRPGGGQPGDRNGRSGYTQPPLPPGPPPPLPRRNGGRPRGGGARY